MKYKAIFFDLDGTLTNPEEGILNSIQYAADYYGISTVRNDLKKYIGPPLKDTFRELFEGKMEISDSLLMEAVLKYRERFEKQGGLFENEIYPDVKETLSCLKKRGYILCTASSKPQVFVERILKHFLIDEYFDFIGGASLDEKVSSKEEVIDHVIKNTNLKSSEILMIGDRKYDLLGAAQMGMDAVGVLYGFGDYAELSACPNIAIISDVKEFLDILD